MGAVAALAPLPSARQDGWEGRLAAVIDDARRRPYVLGEHDCFRVACRVVEALTGVDRWPAFAGYRTRREALLKLAQYGGTFEAAGDWFFGAPAVDVRWARRGDLLALQTEDGEKHAAVCVGVDAALLVEGGLVFVPAMTCLCCWRIG